MKTFFVIFFWLWFLFSCTSQTSTLENATGLTLFENTEFSMNIPSNWSILTNSWNVIPEPKYGKIAFAATSNELKYGFSNNLLILSQKLDKNINSLDFSILNNVWSTKEYIEYTKLESKSFEFVDKEKSNLYIFEAKYNTTTPKLKFLQVGKVCSLSQAYLLTIALAIDIKDTSKYETILKTFTCK